MNNTDSKGAVDRSGWRASFGVAFAVALVVFAAAFWIGMPYPLAKANSLALWWGIAAVVTVTGLAFSRGSHPWSSALAPLSIYCVLNAGFAIFIRETWYFQARVGYESEYRLIGDILGASWSNFLVGVLPAALLAICWALAMELWLPRRGALTTGILIAACATLLGIAALNAYPY